MSDTLQENALYGQASALKVDVVARAIKARKQPRKGRRAAIVLMFARLG